MNGKRVNRLAEPAIASVLATIMKGSWGQTQAESAGSRWEILRRRR